MQKYPAWLRRNNWVVLRLWEHNIKKDIDKEINKITNKLNELSQTENKLSKN